jgi:predicted O-linked N-acetylglucosamine transferase (SPINDLY family)
VFFEPPAAHLAGRLRERLAVAFLARSVDPARSLVWVPWQSPADFFSLMRRADACLDTPGFSGFNTVMQAVECDLPVVGFEGRFMRGRLASGVLRAMGVEELIARDETEYIALAVRLARDSQFRTVVRARLRAAKQALFRDRVPVEALADFIHQRLALL